MPEVHTLDCFQPGIGKLERVAYFNRMLLTADDMRTDQEFVVQKLRRHNRFLHGWGVVCGLIVKAAPTPTKPWLVEVGEGYALGPFGDEIFVGQPVLIDLASCGPGATTSPCEPGMLLDGAPTAGPTVFLAIKYAECRARPVLAMPGGCGCEDEECEYLAHRDSFSIQCLSELPPSHKPVKGLPTLCDVAAGRALLQCVPCPTDPWVVLAKISLPASPTAKIADAAIDNKPPIRRIVFSTAALQAQIIDCCCGDDHEPPAPPHEANLVIRKEVREERRDNAIVLHYNIFVRNLGPDAAENVVVVDNLSGIAIQTNQLQNFIATGGGRWLDKAPPEIVADVARLEPNADVQFSFEVVLTFRQVPNGGVLTNVAIVKSDTPAGPRTEDRAETRTEVRPG